MDAGIWGVPQGRYPPLTAKGLAQCQPGEVHLSLGLWCTDVTVYTAETEIPVPVVAERFERWMELGLHPNIVAAYFVWSAGGIPRLICELSDAPHLRESLPYHNSDVIWKVDAVIGAARGLAYLHSKGFVHGELTSESVIAGTTCTGIGGQNFVPFKIKNLFCVSPIELDDVPDDDDSIASDSPATTQDDLVALGVLTLELVSGLGDEAAQYSQQELIAAAYKKYSFRASQDDIGEIEEQLFNVAMLWVGYEEDGEGGVIPSQISTSRLVQAASKRASHYVGSTAHLGCAPNDWEYRLEWLGNLYEKCSGEQPVHPSMGPSSEVMSQYFVCRNEVLKGLRLADEGDAENAETTFAKALEVDPQCVDARMNLLLARRMKALRQGYSATRSSSAPPSMAVRDTLCELLALPPSIQVDTIVAALLVRERWWGEALRYIDSTLKRYEKWKEGPGRDTAQVPIRRTGKDLDMVQTEQLQAAWRRVFRSLQGLGENREAFLCRLLRRMAAYVNDSLASTCLLPFFAGSSKLEGFSGHRPQAPHLMKQMSMQQKVPDAEDLPDASTDQTSAFHKVLGGPNGLLWRLCNLTVPPAYTHPHGTGSVQINPPAVTFGRGPSNGGFVFTPVYPEYLLIQIAPEAMERMENLLQEIEARQRSNLSLNQKETLTELLTIMLHDGGAILMHITADKKECDAWVLALGGRSIDKTYLLNRESKTGEAHSPSHSKKENGPPILFVAHTGGLLQRFPLSPDQRASFVSSPNIKAIKPMKPSESCNVLKQIANPPNDKTLRSTMSQSLGVVSASAANNPNEKVSGELLDIQGTKESEYLFVLVRQSPMKMRVGWMEPETLQMAQVKNLQCGESLGTELPFFKREGDYNADIDEPPIQIQKAVSTRASTAMLSMSRSQMGSGTEENSQPKTARNLAPDTPSKDRLRGPPNRSASMEDKGEGPSNPEHAVLTAMLQLRTSEVLVCRPKGLQWFEIPQTVDRESSREPLSANARYTVVVPFLAASWVLSRDMMTLAAVTEKCDAFIVDAIGGDTFVRVATSAQVPANPALLKEASSSEHSEDEDDEDEVSEASGNFGLKLGKPPKMMGIARLSGKPTFPESEPEELVKPKILFGSDPTLIGVALKNKVLFCHLDDEALLPAHVDHTATSRGIRGSEQMGASALRKITQSLRLSTAGHGHGAGVGGGNAGNLGGGGALAVPTAPRSALRGTFGMSGGHTPAASPSTSPVPGQGPPVRESSAGGEKKGRKNSSAAPMLLEKVGSIKEQAKQATAFGKQATANRSQGVRATVTQISNRNSIKRKSSMSAMADALNKGTGRRRSVALRRRNIFEHEPPSPRGGHKPFSQEGNVRVLGQYAISDRVLTAMDIVELPCEINAMTMLCGASAPPICGNVLLFGQEGRRLDYSPLRPQLRFLRSRLLRPRASLNGCIGTVTPSDDGESEEYDTDDDDSDMEGMNSLPPTACWEKDPLRLVEAFLRPHLLVPVLSAPMVWSLHDVVTRLTDTVPKQLQSLGQFSIVYNALARSRQREQREFTAHLTGLRGIAAEVQRLLHCSQYLPGGRVAHIGLWEDLSRQTYLPPALFEPPPREELEDDDEVGSKSTKRGRDHARIRTPPPQSNPEDEPLGVLANALNMAAAPLGNVSRWWSGAEPPWSYRVRHGVWTARSLDRHSTVSGLAVDDNGQTLALTLLEGTVELWKLQDHVFVKTLCILAHDDAPYDISEEGVKPNQNSADSARDGERNAPRTGGGLRTPMAAMTTRGSFNVAAVNRSEGIGLKENNSGDLNVGALASNSSASQLGAKKPSLRGPLVSLSLTGKVFVTGGRHVAIWDTMDGELVGILNFKDKIPPYCEALAIGSDGGCVFAQTSNAIYLWQNQQLMLYAQPHSIQQCIWKILDMLPHTARQAQTSNLRPMGSGGESPSAAGASPPRMPLKKAATRSNLEGVRVRITTTTMNSDATAIAVILDDGSGLVFRRDSARGPLKSALVLNPDDIANSLPKIRAAALTSTHVLLQGGDLLQIWQLPPKGTEKDFPTRSALKGSKTYKTALVPPSLLSPQKDGKSKKRLSSSQTSSTSSLEKSRSDEMLPKLFFDDTTKSVTTSIKIEIPPDANKDTSKLQLSPSRKFQSEPVGETANDSLTRHSEIRASQGGEEKSEGKSSKGMTGFRLGLAAIRAVSGFKRTIKKGKSSKSQTLKKDGKMEVDPMSMLVRGEMMPECVTHQNFRSQLTLSDFKGSMRIDVSGTHLLCSDAESRTLVLYMLPIVLFHENPERPPDDRMPSGGLAVGAGKLGRDRDRDRGDRSGGREGIRRPSAQISSDRGPSPSGMAVTETHGYSPALQPQWVFSFGRDSESIDTGGMAPAFVAVPFADRVIFAVGGRVEDAVIEWDWTEAFVRLHEERIRNLPPTVGPSNIGIPNQLAIRQASGMGASIAAHGSTFHGSTLNASVLQPNHDNSGRVSPSMSSFGGDFMNEDDRNSMIGGPRTPRGLSQIRASGADHQRSSISGMIRNNASSIFSDRNSKFQNPRNRLQSQGEETAEELTLSLSVEQSYKVIFAHLGEDTEAAQEVTTLLPTLPCSLQSSSPRSANCGMVPPTPMEFRWSQDPEHRDSWTIVGTSNAELASKPSPPQLASSIQDSQPATGGLGFTFSLGSASGKLQAFTPLAPISVLQESRPTTTSGRQQSSSSTRFTSPPRSSGSPRHRGGGESWGDDFESERSHGQLAPVLTQTHTDSQSGEVEVKQMHDSFLRAISRERLEKHNNDLSFKTLTGKEREKEKKKQEPKNPNKTTLIELEKKIPVHTEEEDKKRKSIAAKAVESTLLINRSNASRKSTRSGKSRSLKAAALSFHTKEDDEKEKAIKKHAIERFAELAKPSSQKTLFTEDFPSIAAQRKRYAMPPINPIIPDAIIKSGCILKLK